MAIYEVLDDAKKYVAGLKKKYKFHQANKQRDKAANLLSDIIECQGKLGVCKKEFNSIIKLQSHTVREGREKGMDVMIQQSMLFDAAVGYLLVRDAIFALDSISSNDSIAHAYDLLEAATLQMQGKKPKTGLIPGLVTNKRDRDKYGHLTAETSVANKEAYVETFFDELIKTGDIEACIAKSSPSAIHDGNVMSQYLNGGASLGGNPLEDSMAAINAMAGTPQPSEAGYNELFKSINNADAPRE